MKLTERKCGLCEVDGREQGEAAWIVVCNTPDCGGILADESECNPYVAQLERELERLQLIESHVRAFIMNPELIGELLTRLGYVEE